MKINITGCFWATFEGHWSIKDNGKMLLVFPECTDVIDLLGPNRCGKKEEAAFVSQSYLKFKGQFLVRNEMIDQ